MHQSAFERRAVAVAPSCALHYDATEWEGALVVVEEGEIELEWLGGSCHKFQRGDVIWLYGLRLRALHNNSREPALLVAVTRNR
jgi:hypothetical protein